MRKLTDTDLTNVLGTAINGYNIEAARIKRGEFIDSDHYGIILAKNKLGYFVTWEWHLDEDGNVNPYWGHYFLLDEAAALKDYENRDLNVKPFNVTITETLRKTVEVEAKDQDEAEQIVSDNWKKGDYVLDADNFHGVEFKAISVDEDKSSQ